MSLPNYRGPSYNAVTITSGVQEGHYLISHHQIMAMYTLGEKCYWLISEYFILMINYYNLNYTKSGTETRHFIH